MVRGGEHEEHTPDESNEVNEGNEARESEQAPVSEKADEDPQKFDLEERTARFGEAVIAFAKRIPVTPVTRPLISQIVRAGTSVGSNYAEADDAESKRDFRHKIGLCRKEARESKHWFRMLATAVPDMHDEAVELWKEARQLHLIFVTIRRNTHLD